MKLLSFAVKFDKLLVKVRGWVNAESKLVRGSGTVSIASPQHYCRWHERHKRFPNCVDEK